MTINREYERIVTHSGQSQLARLLTVARAMGYQRDLTKLLPMIAENVADTLNSDRCGIFLVDKDADAITSMVATGEQSEIRFPMGVGIAGHVIATAEILHIPDAYKDERFNQEIDKKTGYRTRNILCAPLMTMTGEVLGCFEVINKREGDFNKEDEDLLVAFGSHAAAAIESAQLHQQNQHFIDELIKTHHELRTKIRQMQVIHDTERDLNISHNMQEFMQRVIANAARACGSLAGSILLLDHDHDNLVFSFQVGDNSNALRQMSLSTGEGIAGHVLRTGKSILDNEVAKNEQHSRRIDEILCRRTDSIMAVPLLEGNRAIGVLEVVNSQSGRFTEEDLSFLEVISAQITSMILRRKLLDEREQAGRLAIIGQLASSILHDLKNPMAAIKGFAELLMDPKTDAKDRKEYGEIICGQVDRCVSMTKEVLRFARGDRDYDFAAVDAEVFFKEIEQILDVETRNLEITVDVEVDPPSGWVCDAERLKRVIFNLTNNAIEATPRGGMITIACRPAGNDVEIRVADTGDGVPEHVRKHLFEAFATSGKDEGTGLGLHIARDIVEQHGGTISLDPAYDRGACFLIRLPLQPTPKD